MLESDMLLYILYGELMTLGLMLCLILLEELRLRVVIERNEVIRGWLENEQKRKLREYII